MPEGRTASRRSYSTRTKWEFQLGYSRAVRDGEIVRLSGTAGLDENGEPVSGGPAAQMRRALEIAERALSELGASFADVIQTRVYVKDAASITDVAIIHGDVFREIRPATTIVQAGFVDPKILVEVEMEALVRE
jgi:enamine deaminase RidA (YjgF/YER057c/UK114 family)